MSNVTYNEACLSCSNADLCFERFVKFSGSASDAEVQADVLTEVSANCGSGNAYMESRIDNLRAAAQRDKATAETAAMEYTELTAGCTGPKTRELRVGKVLITGIVSCQGNKKH